MEFRDLNRLQLLEFIYSEEWKQLEDLPISKHRALSHINNPRVDDDDIVLILMYHEKKLAAYLGIFADNIFSGEKKEKIGWLSCIWVDPVMRGKQIGKILTERAFELWNDRIIVTNFTESAKKNYDKTGKFGDLAMLDGIRGYLRFNLHELLPNRNPKNTRFKWLLRFVDACGNFLNSIRLIFVKSGFRVIGVNIEYINQIDEEISELIIKRHIGQLCRRGKEELNWIINFPWMLSGPLNDSVAKKYIFSSVAKRFETLNIKVYNTEGRFIGFLMLVVRDQVLKIPYAWFDKENTEHILNIIYRHMFHYKLNMVTTFHPLLTDFIRNNKTPFYHKRDLKRHYILTKNMLEFLGDYSSLEIMDGDGDSALT